MRKSIIMAVCLLSLVACSKKNNGNPSNPTGTAPNSVTINTGGKSYTVSGVATANDKEHGVWLYNTKDDGKNVLRITVIKSIYMTSAPDFELYILTEPNIKSTGVFSIRDLELTENFSNGENFDEGSGTLNVTQNDNNSIVGTFDITVENSNGSKQVKGTFKATSF